MKAEFKVPVTGAYGFKVYDKNGNERLNLPATSNVITDTAIQRFLQTGNIRNTFTGCGLGVGTTEPQTTDTDLTSPVGQRRNTVTRGSTIISEVIPNVFQHKTPITIVFNTAADFGIDGVQLTEIGLFGSGTFSTEMYSKSLIKDSSGNPTTIQLLPEEVLEVLFEFSVYVDCRTDTLGTFKLNEGTPEEITFDYTLRPLSANTTSGTTPWGVAGGTAMSRLTLFVPGDLVAPTTISLGSAISDVSGTIEPYDPQKLSRTMSYFVGINAGNSSQGIGRLSFGGSSSNLIQCKIESQVDGAGIMKTNEYTLNFDKFLNVSFSREMPTGL